MKIKLQNLLLWILNKYLNGTPGVYAFVGNVEYFSTDYLETEVRMNPEITVKQVLLEAKDFRKNGCPVSWEIAAAEHIEELNRDFLIKELIERQNKN